MPRFLPRAADRRGRMPKRLSKENAEWALASDRFLRGRALTRLAGYLIAAAVALETDILQVLAQAGLRLIGIQATFQDTPHFVVILFVAAAVVLLIADALISNPGPSSEQS